MFYDFYSLTHFVDLRVGLVARYNQIYLKHLKKFTLILSIFLQQLIIIIDYYSHT